MKKNIFENSKKNLTKPTHYTIKSWIVDLVKEDSKKYGISESKIVCSILEEYYKNRK